MLEKAINFLLVISVLWTIYLINKQQYYHYNECEIVIWK